jgi:hypothetical protein
MSRLLSVPAKTSPTPYPLFDPASPQQLRDIAYDIEMDLMDDNREFVFERPGLIFIRSALLALADQLER